MTDQYVVTLGSVTDDSYGGIAAGVSIVYQIKNLPLARLNLKIPLFIGAIFYSDRKGNFDILSLLSFVLQTEQKNCSSNQMDKYKSIYVIF